MEVPLQIHRFRRSWSASTYARGVGRGCPALFSGRSSVAAARSRTVSGSRGQGRI